MAIKAKAKKASDNGLSAGRLGEDRLGLHYTAGEAKTPKSAKGTKGTKAPNIVISRPDFRVSKFDIRGDAPYVQNAFSEKALQIMRDAQELGNVGKKGKKRDGKDFDECYEGAKHLFAGSNKKEVYGIPAAAFRKGMISACRMCNFTMTRAKLSFFALEDGMDRDGRTPLVKITKGVPHRSEVPVRLPNGTCDIRPRPLFDAGWEASVRIRFDADQFSLSDIANLILRVGVQVGVGEGRPDSPNSSGVGWGTFELIE